MSHEVLVGLNVIDDPKYRRYREAMIPILTRFGGRFGYDFKISEVLKSEVEEEINRVFTIIFPSKETMQSFFADPDYLVVRKKYFLDSVANTTIISSYTK